MRVKESLEGQVRPTRLRCEYRSDPLGIDIETPRLSWIPDADGRGQVQTAYQIRVASAEALLAEGRSDLWDSGRVESGESTHIAFDGQSPGRGTFCYWIVRLWDRDRHASDWSDTASWSVGPCRQEDWTAEWIGHDAPYAEVIRLGRAPVIDTRHGMAGSGPIRIARRVVNSLIGTDAEDLYAWWRAPQRLLRRLWERAALPLVARIFLNRMSSKPLVLARCPYLRRSFQIERPPTRAILYASALGVYDLHLNGERVTEDIFSPGWSDYERRVYYRAYDVGELLLSGENVIGAVLSDGWYAGYLGPGRRRNHYGMTPRLRLELHLEHEDGDTTVVASDRSWRAKTGPHLEADIQMGETYDARREMRGWCASGFDDGSWSSVDTDAPFAPRMEWAPHGAVRRRRTIEPVAVTELRPGCQIVDMGENFAGWARLTLSAPRGTRVTMRFGERLDADGSLYVANLRGARATDTFISGSEGLEIWEPRFTYHGFQFVEVTGFPGELTAAAIEGVAISSLEHDFEAFECSSPLVNTLFRNIVRTQEANFIEVPTDCPQRDERLGWLGDAQIFARAATFNADVAPFFAKWLVDVDDAREESNGYTDFAPLGRWRREGSPAWADAGIICPWIMYHVYEDRQLLAQHYDSMCTWVDTLHAANPDHRWLRHLGNNNGEWLELDAETPKYVFSTAYYAYTVALLVRIARALGHGDDAARYAALHDSIREAFSTAYVGHDGEIEGDTQACYTLALAFDLLGPDQRAGAARRLVADLEGRKGRPTTGFFGTGYLARVLTEQGSLDTAYRVLMSEAFPSWGYSIKQGATTIWERWDGWSERDGFQDPRMNSFSHYGFGAIGEWLFTTVCGIDTDGPGYRRTRIEPRPGGGLVSARGHYDSPRGRIAVAWQRDEGSFSLDVSIPANTFSTVVLPCPQDWVITESGREVQDVAEAELLPRGLDVTALRIGSGRYQFRCSRPGPPGSPDAPSATDAT